MLTLGVWCLGTEALMGRGVPGPVCSGLFVSWDGCRGDGSGFAKTGGGGLPQPPRCISCFAPDFRAGIAPFSQWADFHA